MVITLLGSEVELLRRPHGILELRSTRPRTEPPPSTLHWLAHWAETTPGAVFLTEESDGTRHEHGYAAVWGRVVREAQGLLAEGVRPGDRVTVIAPNGLTHFVTGHAAMLIGAVYVPIATQYLGPRADPARLDGVLDLVGPALVLVGPGASVEQLPRGTTTRSELLSTPGGEPDLAAGRGLLAGINPTAATKMLLTSGSTGTPKAVVYTQRMLASNALATADAWPFVRDHGPTLVDWLPWNHAFGGNANLNMVLIGGGTLHIDAGGGRPEALGRSIQLIKRFRPTFYAAVPAGFQTLLPRIEDDMELREALLGRSDALFSAGAAMPASTFHHLRELSLTVRGSAVPILSGWGSTEMGPGATIVPPRDSRPGWIGPPLPGVVVKLVPTADKYELRVKGHSVMPGYWRQPELTAAVFDDEGFYCSGDAGLLVDESDPDLGLQFDGRLTNDFKLANGSWVNVDRLRDSLLSLGGEQVRDVVVAGPDRPHLVAVFWVDHDAELDVAQVLARHNAAHSGQTNLVLAGEAVRGDLDPDLLSPKGTIKPARYRTAEAARIDAIYEHMEENDR